MRYVALLRAINVGKRRVKMDELRSHFEDLGFGDVATHIQSGNVIFASRKREPSLVSLLEAELESRLGFDVPTMIRSVDQMAAMVAAWPFDEPGAEDTGFVGFLNTPPEPEAVAHLSGAATDELAVVDRHVYWFRHDRDTDLTNNRIEKTLGVTCTLRNLTVSRRLAELAATDS